MILPSTHIRRSRLNPKINYLSCSCSWKSVYIQLPNHTYSHFLTLSTEIVESHFRQHIREYFLELSTRFHGQPDIYNPPKPIITTPRLVGRLHPRLPGVDYQPLNYADA